MKAIKCVGQRLSILLFGAGANQNGISFIDVKRLYDAAYEEKERARACLRTFNALLKKAEKLDAAYRVQLAADHARLNGKAA